MFNSTVMKIRLCAILILLLLSTSFCSGKKETRPEGSFDPKNSFVFANEQIEKKDYEGARATLLEIKNKDTSHEIAPLAQLKIADSYIKEDEPERGIAEYQKFLEEYPDHQYAPYAQYQIAMVSFNKIEDAQRGYGYAAQALKEFEKLKEMFPRNPYRDVIDLRIKQCRNTIAEYEFLVGDFYYKKGSYSAAIGRLDDLLKTYPEYQNEASVLFYIGMSYKYLGQDDKAREYLTRLIEKYPNNKIIKKAKEALDRLKP
jgi:outer membrane protein assembly factor BamD